MTIFTAIKYPIDINFRIEDLERIPTQVLSDWWLGYFYKIGSCYPAYIHAYLSHPDHQEDCAIMLTRLKQALNEWDNSE